MAVLVCCTPLTARGPMTRTTLHFEAFDNAHELMRDVVAMTKQWVLETHRQQ